MVVRFELGLLVGGRVLGAGPVVAQVVPDGTLGVGENSRVVPVSGTIYSILLRFETDLYGFGGMDMFVQSTSFRVCSLN